MDAERVIGELQGQRHQLVRALTVLCGDAAVAEDSVQEAMVRAWQRMEAGESLTNPVAWVRSVALNQVRSDARRSAAGHRAWGRWRRRSIERNEVDAGDSASLAEETLRLRAALDELPPRQREVIVLHYLLELSVHEVAAACGISSGATKNALHHARRHLATSLGATSGKASSHVDGDLGAARG